MNSFQVGGMCCPGRVVYNSLQISRLNHISAASGVAYAETCGATTLPNWTEVGLKAMSQVFGAGGFA